MEGLQSLASLEYLSLGGNQIGRITVCLLLVLDYLLGAKELPLPDHQFPTALQPNSVFLSPNQTAQVL